jgi:uncharacterized protein (DUF2141 family)
MTNFFRTVISLLVLGSIPVSIKSQNNLTKISVEFSNVKTNKGILRLGIFINDKEFEDEKPFFKIDIAKTDLKNGKFITTINLPLGKYGISVLDDENNNAKMDYNLIGIPKEGFGFSNYYHSGFSKPKLSQFIFTVDNTVLELKFKIRYM